MDKDEKILWGDGKVWKTKSQFFTYIRGCLRKAWNRHPNKILALKKYAIKIDNPNKKSSVRFPKVSGYCCTICNKNITAKEAVVDHITPAGSLIRREDIQGFAERLLFVEVEDLRVICKDCNNSLAYADKHNISFDDAVIAKKVISFEKNKSVTEEIEKRGIKPASNAKLRREQLIDILKNEESING